MELTFEGGKKMSQNLNKPDYLVMPEVNGVKVFKILQVTIDDNGNYIYRCLLEDGNFEWVPKEKFDEVNK